jgi:hypothetical protein
MSDEQKSTEATPVEVECPKCKHKFWHKLGHAIKEGAKEAADSLGNAIGEAKFGGS